GASACLILGQTPTLTGSGNLIQENAGCPGTVATADPMLGPLAYNGGLTPTMAITDSSPAFDAGDASQTLLRDQRGATRPQGAAPDIGAYEACVFNPKEDCFGFHSFTPTRHLDTSAFPTGAGTVFPPSGDFPLNSVQPLTAVPEAGSSFVRWIGNVADSTDPSTFIPLDQDQTLTATLPACAIHVGGRGTAGSGISPPRIDLTWAPNGAEHADVLRAAASGGPYALVGASSTTWFSDRSGLANNTTWYYVLQFFTAGGARMC